MAQRQLSLGVEMAVGRGLRGDPRFQQLTRQLAAVRQAQTKLAESIPTTMVMGERDRPRETQF